MLCKTKSRGAFETEPKKGSTSINPINQSPNPKIRAITGYFQSQKHVLLVQIPFSTRRHTILTYLSFHIIYHFIVRLIVHLGSFFFSTKKQKTIVVLRVCGATVSFVPSAQTVLSSQFQLSPHHNWNHLWEILMGVTHRDGQHYRRRWNQDKTLSRSMSTPRVLKTHALWATAMGLLSTWGYLALNAALVIQLTDSKFLFAVNVVSDTVHSPSGECST